jgi:hypothetical protein
VARRSPSHSRRYRIRFHGECIAHCKHACKRKASTADHKQTIFALVFLLLRVVGYSTTITSTSMSRHSWSDSLPDLAGIAYRREALAKLRLLSLSFTSLLRLARLLLGVRPLICAAEEDKSQRRNQKNKGGQLFHKSSRTIIKRASAATFQESFKFQVLRGRCKWPKT